MSGRDIDGFAGGHRHPLTCVRSVASTSVDGTGVSVRCRTVLIGRQSWNRYGTPVPVGVPLGPGPDVTLRVDVVDPAVIRVRFCRGERVPDNHTPFLVDATPRGARPAVHDTATCLRLETSKLTLTLERSPLRMVVADRDGRVVFRTMGLGTPQPAPTGVPVLDLPEPERDTTSIAAGWPWFVRELLPLGFVEDPDTGETQTFETWSLRPDEHLYGFGERFGPLDKRGQAFTLWQANAMGNTWPESYKNVPFFMSSRGYGHFLNSAHPVRYHLGARSHVHASIQVQDGLLDYFLIVEPTFKRILPHYTRMTGPPELPPFWSFGLWMSRMSYHSADEVEATATRLRKERVPCDVVHLDDSWMKEDCVNDVTFAADRFPDPEAFLGRLRKDGFRVSVWQTPYINTTSDIYRDGEAAGAFARREDGAPYLIEGVFGPAAVIDFSSPAGADWYTRRLRALFELGVAAIKTDFGEGAPPDAVYFGHSGAQMHNLYPFLYNRAVFECTREATGDSIVWARSAYAGSQRFPVHWGGDSVSRWEDLANGLSGGLGLSMCGFPFWSQDIGGFVGTPSPRLYVRWAQAGLLLTHARAHGTSGREPWLFGAEALAIFRRYVELRYRLLPYLWSEAVHGVGTGQPVMRPMVFEWPHDPSTHPLADQYLLGEHLLVAPVVTEDDHRTVYLPEGRWLDYWTSETHDGPRWLEVAAPLDTVPLFLREGAVVPHAAPAPHTGQLDWTRLRLEIVPDLSGRTRRYVVDRSPADLPAVAVTHRHEAGWLSVRVDIDDEVDAGGGDYEIAVRSAAGGSVAVRGTATRRFRVPG